MTEESRSEGIPVAIGPAVKVELDSKVGHALLLIASTALVLWVLVQMVQQLDRPYEVGWEPPDGLELAVEQAPVEFRYDPDARVLSHRGPISEEVRTRLLGIPRSTVAAGGAPLAELTGSYRRAIADLTFWSQQPISAVALMLLGGVGALLGVQMRSIWLFVWITCYADEQYDLSKWWPWYVMRPLLGFVLGFALFALIDSNLLKVQTARSENEVWWWLAMSILVGFVSLDFVSRLEKVARTVFGITERQGG